MSFSAKIKAIEARMPGWHVAAGPFELQHAFPKSRRDEVRMCAIAKAEQMRAGHEVKVVMTGGEGWVLRVATAEDLRGQRNATRQKQYLDMRSERSRALSLRDRTLCCPLCGAGPFDEKGLRLHGCPKKALRKINGRLLKGRLDNDEIAHAKEVAA